MSKLNLLKLVLAITSAVVAIGTKPAFALNPTAIATTTNVTVAGGTSYLFTVTYNDDGEIEYGTLDSGDVRITAPGGFSSATTFVSAHSTTGHNAIVTYSLVPRGGSWDTADNGTYTVVMQANQVTDGLGNPVAPGPIGAFTVSVPSGTPPPEPAWQVSALGDFNHDGKPDYLLFNASTRHTAIWYLNNNTFVSSATGPTIPSGWGIVDVADFNRDGKPDLVLSKSSTRQTVIWYMNNNVPTSSAYGPTPPSGWQLVETGDINGDGKPDFVLYNSSSRRTAIWYMNNNSYSSGVFGPTLAAGLSLAGLADFNRDGKLDYLLFNPSTSQSAIWYLNANIFISQATGPTIPSGWMLSGTADFNRDGKPDYLLYSSATRHTAIWYLNNNVYVSGSYGPTLPPN